MLKHLTIKNYALIQGLEAKFFDGFSVITGETGAGKSIILGALSLILGQRADLQALKNKSEKCIVEGIFDTQRNSYEDFFTQNNLDFDPATTILRREILPSGKSRAFINDTPVALNQLRELASQLVDLHSQNSTALIHDNAFQLAVVDNFCKNAALLSEYKGSFFAYKKLQAELKDYKETERTKAGEQDFLIFQHEELEKAQLRSGEQEETEEELAILEHAEEIKSHLFNAAQTMDREHGLNAQFGELIAELKPLAKMSQELAAIYQRIESNYLDLNDISSEINKIDEHIEVNPSRTEDLNERINLIYRLQQKHKVSSIDELLKIQEDYAQKIQDYSSLAHEIAKLEKQCDAHLSALSKVAEQLSGIRKKHVCELAANIAKTIAQIGMPHAQVKIHFDKLDQPAENGIDRVNFLFNANKNSEMLEMSKIASGGELSRLMLAIKAQVAVKNLVSTIIFDEIDSGVSGEVAAKMAAIMQQMGKDLQIIAITHLPQIAARGQNHYLVSKDQDAEETITHVNILNQEQRIIEIAKMLSDTTVSSSAIKTAEELMRK